MTPTLVKQLVDSGISVVVQPSNYRCYSDGQFVNSGATISDDLSPCDVIFGVKPIKPDMVLEGKTYFMYSRIASAMPASIPLKEAFMAQRCSFIDYEEI